MFLTALFYGCFSIWISIEPSRCHLSTANQDTNTNPTISKENAKLIYTYYDPSVNNELTNSSCPKEVLAQWLRNWYSHGYQPHILNLDAAQRHSDYAALMDKLATDLPIRNAKNKQPYYTKWIAYAQIGQEIRSQPNSKGTVLAFSDCDVFRYHIPCADYRKNNSTGTIADIKAEDGPFFQHYTKDPSPMWIEAINEAQPISVQPSLADCFFGSLGNYTMETRGEFAALDPANRPLNWSSNKNDQTRESHTLGTLPLQQDLTIYELLPGLDTQGDCGLVRLPNQMQSNHSRLEMNQSMLLLHNLLSTHQISILSPFPNVAVSSLINLATYEMEILEFTLTSIPQKLEEESGLVSTFRNTTIPIEILADAEELVLKPPQARYTSNLGEVDPSIAEDAIKPSNQIIFLFLSDPVKHSWRLGKYATDLVKLLFPNSVHLNTYDSHSHYDEFDQAEVNKHYERQFFWLLNRPDVRIVMTDEAPQDVKLFLEYTLGIILPPLHFSKDTASFHHHHDYVGTCSQKTHTRQETCHCGGADQSCYNADLEQPIDPMWLHSFEQQNQPALLLYRMAKEIWDRSMQEMKGIESQLG